MSGRKSYLFCFGIVMALAASMGVAHAVTCTPVGSTVTCTGGPAAHVSVANGFAAFTTIAATTYPTTINVTGGSGTVSSLTLTLHGYTSMSGAGFNSSRNVGLLLKSPTSRNLQIMRAAGAATCTVAAGAPDITHCQSNLTFTIQDGAAAFPDPLATPPNNQWFSGGTFKPTAYPSGGVGPASPDYTVSGGPAMVNTAAPNTVGMVSATLASVFAGDTVNGNWSLYLVDDFNNKADVQFASWDIAITFSNATTPSTTTLATNPTNPFTAANVLLSAQVTNTATGTVTFKDNGVNVTCAEGPQPEALNGSSVAVCTTTFSTEGIHPLTANYSGDGTFVSSIGSANVFVQNHACNGAGCAPVEPTTTYCNTGTVTNDGHSDLGYAHTTPYPSAIIVGDGTNADITQAVSTLSVTLKGFTSSNSSQVRMLLVAPDGTHAYDFWSNAGNGAAGTGDYTIIDGATQLPSGGNLSPGTYGPAGYGILPDPFTPGPPAPAPQIPGSFSYASPMGNPNSKTFITAFTGTGAHGTWSLFLHNAGGAGTSTSFATGWCLAITPATGHPTTTGLMANPTNANLGAPVIFTATVASSGQPTPNQGTVTFTENGGPLIGAPNGGVANVVNGVATIVTSGLPEGDHIVNAQYHDSTNFYSDSIGSVNMRVDKSTSTPTLNGSTWSYCNTGAITIPAGTVVSNDFGPATPNPSNVFVTNLPGTISSLGVTLKQFHDLQPGNLESLLVGPNGLSAPTTAQTLDFFTRAGGVNAYGPADLSFFDGFTAAPNGGALAATNGPASYGATPTYTPSLFYTLPGTFQRATTAGAFTFNTGTYTPNVGGGVYKNTLPNGTWSLYFDQLINDTGSGANNGWCVAFTENPVTVTATKGHTGRPPNGNFQQGHAGASFSFNIKNNGDANGLGSTGDPDGAHPLKVVDVLDASAFTPGTLPTGTPWNCTAVTNTVTCTSSLSIASGSFYPVLVIPVNVLNNAPASATNQGSLSGGGITATLSTSEMVTIDPAPVLAITKAHNGNFTQGQTGSWTLQVANNSATAAGNTDGTTVTVTDTLPTGYTGWSGSGTGWTCVTNNLVVSCTSNDAISGNGGLFPLITLTGTVPAASPTSVSNSATVFGGGDVVHFNSGNAAVSNTNMVTVIQVPAFVNINGSATQSTPINTAFGSLAVTVQDAGHAPIPNYSSVVFTASTGGNGQSGTFAGPSSMATIMTNGSGVADPGTFTANTKTGAYTVDVAAGPAPHATFNLTNTAGPPTQMTANANTTPQTAQVTQAFGTALGVTVLDALNNPVQGVMVTFTAPVQTGASGKFANNTGTTTATTDVNGVATATTFTANTHAGGPYNVAATATGPPTVNFALINTPGPPTQMTTNANTTPQSAQVTQAFGTLLGVTVTDANNNPVMGVMVTFTAPVQTGASGLFANTTGTTTATTDVNGVATATTFTANTHAGGYNVAATATGPPTVNFALTNTAGSAMQMTATANTTPQSAQVTQAFGTALGVKITDGSSNPVQGVLVTFTAPNSGASGKFANNTNTTQATTDVNGVATATTFTANTLAGGYNVAATASGLTTVNFALTNLAGPPTQMAANANTTPQSAPVNTQFGTLLSVTLKDVNNNLVSGALVTFTAPGSGASGLFANNTVTTQATTDVNGVATATAFTANGTAGGPYNVAATATGPSAVNFALTNLPGTVVVTVSTNINGPTVSVDGGAFFTGSQMFTWTIGSPHSLSTSTPQTNAGTQYVWLNWSDAGAITHIVMAPALSTTYTATFKTQYQLTTGVSPNATEGSISPATGFFDAGSMVPVTATANAGYAFTGFTGGLSGTTNPQNITMNAPATVTANFAPGPTSLGGSFGTKTGPIGGQRVWTVNIGNNGPGVALGAKVTSFTLVQTTGTACNPTVLSAMPQLAGDIPPGGTMGAHVTIDFTNCFSNSFFKVTATVSANGGAAMGTIVRLNQLQ